MCRHSYELIWPLNNMYRGIVSLIIIFILYCYGTQFIKAIQISIYTKGFTITVYTPQYRGINI